MNLIKRTSLVALIPLVLLGVAGSAGVTAGGSASGSLAYRPGADAIPTTTVLGRGATPVTPTTSAPNNPPSIPTTAVAPTIPPPTAVPPPTVLATSYIPLTDDTGMLSVEVPATWVDVDTRPFVNADGTLRPGISASTDLESFNDDWNAPGLLYMAYPFEPDPNVLFGRYDYTTTCTDGGIVTYNDQVFAGYVRTFTDCADAASQNYVIVANAPGNAITIVLIVQVLTAEDASAYQRILETFNIDPNVSMPTETVPPPTTTAPPTTTPLPTTPLPSAPPTAAAPVTAAPVTATPLPTSPLVTTIAPPTTNKAATG